MALLEVSDLDELKFELLDYVEPSGRLGVPFFKVINFFVELDHVLNQLNSVPNEVFMLSDARLNQRNVAL